MRLHVQNFMGVKRANIDISGLTLIVGPNWQGKSSIAMAAAAALTGEILPYKDLLKKHAQEIVTEGAETAVVFLEDLEQNQIRLDYPTCTRSSKGDKVPKASAIAAGLQSLIDMDHKERAKILGKFLGAELSRTDVEIELLELGAKQTAIFGICEEVELKGADGARETFRERGAKLKGRWEQVTGVKDYKSSDWIPAYWTPDMATATEDELQRHVDRAKREYEDMLKVEAITESEKAQLLELAAGKPEAERKAKAAGEAYHEAEQIVEKALVAMEAHKVVTEIEPRQSCPHCAGLLTVDKNKIIRKADEAKASPEVLKEDLKLSARYAGAYERAKQQRDARKEDLTLANADLNACIKAEQKLARISQTVDVKPDMEAAGKRVDMAEKRLKCFKAKMEADEIQTEIRQLVKIVNMLAPEGLRRRKLKEAIKVFNTRLLQLATKANWQYLTLTEDLELVFGGRQLWKCSAAQKFCAKVLLQAAWAERDDSALIIVDGADIFDKTARNGLVNLLKELGKPALVTMTMTSDKDKIPDLKAAGLGVTYTITDGLTAEYNGAPQS